MDVPGTTAVWMWFGILVYIQLHVFVHCMKCMKSDCRQDPQQTQRSNPLININQSTASISDKEKPIARLHVRHDHHHHHYTQGAYSYKVPTAADAPGAYTQVSLAVLRGWLLPEQQKTCVEK